MTTKSLVTLAGALTGMYLVQTHARAQGSLTPPAGAPAPVMKTLDQVEARIPLVSGQPGVSVSPSGTVTITSPGSYYLTGNLIITNNVDGLVVNADATVDLNGFGIIGTNQTGVCYGIVLGTNLNITVRNGFVRGGVMLPNLSGWGLLTGIFCPYVTPNNASYAIYDVSVSNLRDVGINLFVADTVVVDRCRVNIVRGDGISTSKSSNSRVQDSSVQNCWGYAGISARHVTGCYARCSSSYPYSTYVGIDGVMVEHSTGIADGSASVFDTHYGIAATVASYCIGKASPAGGSYHAITATTAIGCVDSGGGISAPQKFLGTP